MGHQITESCPGRICNMKLGERLYNTWVENGEKKRPLKDIRKGTLIKKIVLKWIWREQVVKMWIGVMWVSKRNHCFVGCRVHLNHDPRSINLGKFSISWITTSFSRRCTVATKSEVLKSGVTEVYQRLHASPPSFRTLPFPSVCTHVTTAQTVKLLRNLVFKRFHKIRLPHFNVNFDRRVAVPSQSL